MKIVIQCAGSKRSDAGNLTDQTGGRIMFVAHPERIDASQSTGRFYRPEDTADPTLGTWRDALVRYNSAFVQDGSNPDQLLSAGDLYEPPVYGNLVRHFNQMNVFILSAGWGLVRADYLLPDYNITFSKNPKVPPECRRAKAETGWLDFDQLRDGIQDGAEVHFFCVPDYLDLLYSLTSPYRLGCKFVIHHKAVLPHRDGFEYEPYSGKAKTNWHYLAAAEFIRSRS